uniref:Uncharacterized protein n=1 Tax=Arion vulgaris TaxID=1028688 RepID=A0A0B7AMA3_9EUPU
MSQQTIWRTLKMQNTRLSHVDLKYNPGDKMSRERSRETRRRTVEIETEGTWNELS